MSSNTVADYMEALCATYMIDRVRRYDIRGKHVFKQQEKYYYGDLGIRNYLCRDKRLADMEKVLENAVYIKLVNDGYAVYVGQLDGKEIDFVAQRGDEPTIKCAADFFSRFIRTRIWELETHQGQPPQIRGDHGPAVAPAKRRRHTSPESGFLLVVILITVKCKRLPASFCRCLGEA